MCPCTLREDDGMTWNVRSATSHGHGRPGAKLPSTADQKIKDCKKKGQMASVMRTLANQQNTLSCREMGPANIDAKLWRLESRHLLNAKALGLTPSSLAVHGCLAMPRHLRSGLLPHPIHMLLSSLPTPQIRMLTIQPFRPSSSAFLSCVVVLSVTMYLTKSIVVVGRNSKQTNNFCNPFIIHYLFIKRLQDEKWHLLDTIYVHCMR
ncbi:unnamed protein product [Coffea canephora]|uniref:Uncharacterized protein n=1 Tax=Coffea canephora TaxID=49390 RepID=A0A068UKN9_COFCA|nr:unnamed protein product [Coffea canephora]